MEVYDFKTRVTDAKWAWQSRQLHAIGTKDHGMFLHPPANQDLWVGFTQTRTAFVFSPFGTLNHFNPLKFGKTFCFTLVLTPVDVDVLQ